MQDGALAVAFLIDLLSVLNKCLFVPQGVHRVEP